MTTNLDYLLIGNSRFHWAAKIGNQYKFTHSPIGNLIPNEIKTENLLWASVGSHQTNFLKKENQLKIEDINLKNFPKYFGIDRALGSFAALKNTYNPDKKNIIIADFGTILSITKINEKGELIGGQLIPGFLTQLKSMVSNTKALKMPKMINNHADNFLIDTQEAMVKGVKNSLIGAINLAFNPTKDILIICGGDTEIMKPNFLEQKSVLINPNLVMEGLIMAFKKIRISDKR